MQNTRQLGEKEEGKRKREIEREREKGRRAPGIEKYCGTWERSEKNDRAREYRNCRGEERKKVFVLFYSQHTHMEGLTRGL